MARPRACAPDRKLDLAIGQGGATVTGERATTTGSGSGLVAAHLDDVEWIEALPQHQGDRRLAIHLKILVSEPDRLVSFSRYDPGLVVEPHYHGGDEVIYVLEGEMTICGRVCTAGTAMLLRAATPTGPILAGPEGTTMLEVFIGVDAGLPNVVEDARWVELVESLAIRPA